MQDILDGGWFRCDMFASYITLINKQPTPNQIGVTEVRLYSEPNVMEFCNVAFATATAVGYGPGNLLPLSPRTTSSSREPNYSPAGTQSCTIFTEFPAVMTLDMTGTAHVRYILVVGNAAAPQTFNDFRLYVGHSSDYHQNTECPGGPYLGPSDDDYASATSRLGAEVACGATGRYVSLVK